MLDNKIFIFLLKEEIKFCLFVFFVFVILRSNEKSEELTTLFIYLFIIFVHLFPMLSFGPWWPPYREAGPPFYLVAPSSCGGVTSLVPLQIFGRVSRLK